MMTLYEDDIALWNSLGAVNAVRYQWLKFPITATAGNATFRAYFDTNVFQKFQSYLLFRQRFTTESSDQVGLSIRVSVSPIPVIFDLKIPQELADRGIYRRDIEVYRVVTRRPKYSGIITDPQLTIILQELWG